MAKKRLNLKVILFLHHIYSRVNTASEGVSLKIFKAVDSHSGL